jgi:hypothetical protein
LFKRKENCQTVFNGRSVPESETSLLKWTSQIEASVNQLTIDQLFNRPKENKSTQQGKPIEKCEEEAYIEIPKTISCIQLTMKHNKHGNVVGWMKGKPETDSWDGSLDNQEKALESHVSKYGWRF